MAVDLHHSHTPHAVFQCVFHTGHVAATIHWVYTEVNRMTFYPVVTGSGIGPISM